MSPVIVRSNGRIQRENHVNESRMTRRNSVAKMISKNGIVSVYGFLLGLSMLFALLLLRSDLWPPSDYVNGRDVNTLHLFVVYAAITHVLVRIINRGIIYKVNVRQP